MDVKVKMRYFHKKMRSFFWKELVFFAFSEIMWYNVKNMKGTKRQRFFLLFQSNFRRIHP